MVCRVLAQRSSPAGFAAICARVHGLVKAWDTLVLLAGAKGTMPGEQFQAVIQRMSCLLRAESIEVAAKSLQTERFTTVNDWRLRRTA